MEATPHTTNVDVTPGEGLRIPRRFTTPGTHPFDTVEWELREARIEIASPRIRVLGRDAVS